MSEIKLRNYQDIGATKIIKWFKNNPRKNCLALFITGCHAKNHGIMMYDGSIKKVQDVKVGDLLMGDDSTPRKVLSLARGRQDMVKIKPLKGNDEFIVNTDHIFSFAMSGKGFKRDKIQNVTFNEYLNETKEFRHVAKLRKPELVIFPELEKPTLNAWVAGLMLGDGSLQNQPTLTSMDADIVKVFSDYVSSIGDVKIRKNTKPNNKASTYVVAKDTTSSVFTNKFRDLLNENGLWGMKCEFKYIPDSFKFGSVETRFQVLAGLLDSDGHLSYGTEFDFISKSKQLADDITFVARSLGLWASIGECQKGCQNNFVGNYWRVCISGDVEKIPVVKFKDKLRKRKINKSPVVTGFKYELLPEDDYYGFELDGNHLYLDEFFFVHHNTGKSIILSEVIRRILFENPRKKFLVLTSTKELVDQDEQAMLSLWKTAPTGVFCAGLKRKEVAQVTFATIGSIAKKVDLFGSIDYVIIDEVQNCSHNENTQYRRLLNELWQVNEDMQVLGITATAYRMSGGSLLDDHIFHDVAIDATTFESFDWFWRQNYISKIVSKRTVTQLDVSGVKMRHGDFIEHDLQEAVDKEEITRAALTEAVEYGKDRHAWIVFGTGIDHCQHICDMLNNEFNVSARVVHSKMSDTERDTNIADFKAGKYTACVNNIVLLTGFDKRDIDMIIDLQPTNSTSRHLQKYGRSLRIAPKEGMPLDTIEERAAAIAAGKKPNGALILDYSSNCYRNGSLNDPIIPTKKGKKGGGTPPVKTCPVCGTISHPSVRYCPDCDYQFPFEVKITQKASTLDVVATAPRTKIVHNDDKTWMDVHDVSYKKHFSKAGKYSLKITYHCGYNSYNEYKPVEGSYGLFVSWWYKRCNGYAPKTLDEVLLYVSQLAKPTKILVGKNGKYDNVLSHEFPDEKPFIEKLNEVQVEERSEVSN